MAFDRMKLFLPLAALFGCSSALHVAPTHVQVGLQAPTLGMVPLITVGPSAEALELRQAGANNPICGWINGNEGMRWKENQADFQVGFPLILC